jgi:hypothetical protein
MGENFSRLAFLSFVVAVGLAVGLQLWPNATQPVLGSQLASEGLAPNGLITHVIEGDGLVTRIIVVDQQLRSMGIYEISKESGEIQLMSVRRLTADLQMLEFNNTGISVEDIQKAHQRQQ